MAELATYVNLLTPTLEADEYSLTQTLHSAPTTPDLVFFGHQVNFYTPSGALQGGSHFGFQSYPAWGPKEVINWGGYDDIAGGGATNNGNTLYTTTPMTGPSFLFPWIVGRPYEFRVARSPVQDQPSPYISWRLTVTDLVTGIAYPIRDMYVQYGDHMRVPGFWTEDFRVGTSSDYEMAVKNIRWDGRPVEVGIADYGTGTYSNTEVNNDAVKGFRILGGVTRVTAQGTIFQQDQALATPVDGVRFGSSQFAVTLGTPATNVVVTKPTGVVAGNYLLAVAAVTSDAGITPPAPAGFTLKAVWKEAPPALGEMIYLYVYERFADGTEGANFTFNWGASTLGAAAVLRYSNVDHMQLGGFLRTGRLNVSGTSVRPVLPSMYVGHPGSKLVAIDGIRPTFGAAANTREFAMPIRVETNSGWTAINVFDRTVEKPEFTPNVNGTEVTALPAPAKLPASSISGGHTVGVLALIPKSVASSVIARKKPGRSVLVNQPSTTALWRVAGDGVRDLDSAGVPFTPKISLGDTEVTYGTAAVQTGRYRYLGSLVLYTAEITLGTGASFGTGTVYLNAPVPPGSVVNGALQITNGTNYYIARLVPTKTEGKFALVLQGNTVITTNANVLGLAAGYTWSLSVLYEAN